MLLGLAVEVGLDAVRAREILDSDTYSREVVADEDYYTSHGIHAVPAVIIDGRQLISGAQSTEYYEQALRQIARS
ncbi:DSBA-like thioredoxin domain protein [compost metagenome]